MLKSLLLIAAVIATAFGGGCENANLFDSPAPAAPEQSFGIAPSGEVAIAMTVHGGFAGVHRHLAIETNGYVRYLDYGDPDSQVISMPTPEEYEALVAYFLEKNFFNLGDNYYEPHAADLFLYEILFQHAGQEKTVGADELRAPANLRDLIARLEQMIAEMQRNALTLSFHMERQVLRHGETVALTLTAANPHAHTVELASGVQMFEFYALPAMASPRLPAELPSSLVWNYTHGKVYIAIMKYTKLTPGETLTFRASWDGRNNEGELLEGNYLIGAQLVSAPGGFTGLQQLQITK